MFRWLKCQHRGQKKTLETIKTPKLDLTSEFLRQTDWRGDFLSGQVRDKTKQDG